MSHLRPQHPGCSEQSEQVLHVVKRSSRSALQLIVPWIDYKNLTQQNGASGVRQVQALQRQRLTDG